MGVSVSAKTWYMNRKGNINTVKNMTSFFNVSPHNDFIFMISSNMAKVGNEENN